MTPEWRLAIRESYRCPCSGEMHDRRAYRLTDAVLESDAAEQVMVDAEEASGTRPLGCPMRALADPFVLHIVTRAYRWYDKHQLATRYGGRVPASVIWGCETYDAALNGVQVRDMRADRAERKANEAKAALAKPR